MTAPFPLRPWRAALVLSGLAVLAACSSVPDRQAFERFTEARFADAEVMPATLQRQRPKVLVLPPEDGPERLARNGQLGQNVARSVTQILAERAIDVVDGVPAPQLLDALRQAEAAGRGAYEGPAQADIVVRPVITRADYRVDFIPPRVEARQVAVTPPPAAFAPAPRPAAAPTPPPAPAQTQQQILSTTTTTRTVVKKDDKRDTRVVQRQTVTTTATASAGSTAAPVAPPQPQMQAQPQVQAPPQPQYVTTLVTIPASYQHHAAVAGSLQVHALPSLKLLASIPFSATDAMSSPTQPANDSTGTSMLRNAAGRAAQGSRAALLEVFAARGHVTAKRTLEDQTLFQISLGSQDGLRKGDAVELLSLRRQAALFDGTQPPDEEVPVARAVVTEMVAPTTAWVFVKKAPEALKVRRGDVAKLKYTP